MPRGIAANPATDKRLGARSTGKRGGRPLKDNANTRTFTLKVPDALYARLKALGPDAIREALGRL